MSKRLLTSVVILAIIIIYAYVISALAPFDPRRWNVVPPNQPPSLKYPFGTTSLGQDLFWLCAQALRYSITMSLITGLMGIAIAMIIGVIGGYLRGKAFTAITLFIDSFCVIPALPVLVLLFSLWREAINPLTMALWIAVFSWAWPSRYIRSTVMSLRERTFTYTARFSGYSLIDSIRYHYLPYIFGLLISGLLNIMLWAIGIETTLAVFGLLSLAEPTLGLIIFWAMNYLALPRGIWWWIAFPVALLVTLIVSMYFISLELYRRYVL
ncbi:MAG: ABC transporter permease [Desulfurococcaceae archaeon]